MTVVRHSSRRFSRHPRLRWFSRVAGNGHWRG